MPTSFSQTLPCAIYLIPVVWHDQADIKVHFLEDHGDTSIYRLCYHRQISLQRKMQNYCHPFSQFCYLLGCVLSLQCNCNVLLLFQMYCNQISIAQNCNLQRCRRIPNLSNARVSSPSTLKMQGFRISVKTCDCKSFCDWTSSFNLNSSLVTLSTFNDRISSYFHQMIVHLIHFQSIQIYHIRLHTYHIIIQ